jgi:CRISPR-associated protein Csm3
MERVVRGAEFGFEIIYNVEDPAQLEEDFANIRLAMSLLENDYLGGGGTRGNGRVLFKDVEAHVVTGDTTLAVPALG